jgi:proline iminopeptidase
MVRTVETSDGAALWTISGGQGAPILLSNGGPGCCDYLEDMAALLEDRATVIRWEQRGCGRSTADGRYDLATAIEDMEAIRTAYGYDRWIAGGHSWGANLALAYALEHPSRVTSVLYLAGNGAQNDRDWHAQYVAARDERPERQPALAYPTNTEVNRVGNQTWREYIRRPDFLRRVADLDIPILFVCAGLDIRPSWPVGQLAMLAKRGELRVIPEAEHYLHLSHPEELKGILTQFLASLRKTPRPAS